MNLNTRLILLLKLKRKCLLKKSIVLKQSTDFWLLIVFLDSDFLWRLKSMQMQSAERRTHTHAIPLYYIGILLFN